MLPGYRYIYLHIFYFYVSTASIVGCVINNTEPSFMQICVYLMFISTIFGDLLAIVIIQSKFDENETLI